MKKFLEVLVDENGNYTVHSDCEFFDDVQNPPKDFKTASSVFDKTVKPLIKALVETVWKDRNVNVSKAIRYLTLAETISNVQPYDDAEQLWSTLMFGFIPHYEAYADKLKKPYGYKPSQTIRPITIPGLLNTSIFPLSMPFNTKGMS